jgi:hypothetical protein
MEGKTYVELLAENDFLARTEFHTDPRDTLIEANEYEDEHIPSKDHHPDELENQEDFKKFGGSHQQAANFEPAKDNEIKTKQHVEYDKNVRVHVLSIDSRFRDDITQLSTNFTYKFFMPLKNIISVRVSDVELPNTYFTFSPSRGNTIMELIVPNAQNVMTTYTIAIRPGNYDQIDLQTELNFQFNQTFLAIPASGVSTIPGTLTENFLATYNISTGRMSIENLDKKKFSMNFAIEQFAPRIRDFGLGHNLGFRTKKVAGKWAYTGSGLVDVIDSNYLFLTLNPDWKVITHRTPDRSHLYSFAKIIINEPKGAMIFDNGLQTNTREFFFKQPSNITNIPVTLEDPYGQVVDLEGMDFSFTLELIEVLNSSLYETIRSS